MTPLYAKELDLSRYNVLAVDDVPLNLILLDLMMPVMDGFEVIKHVRETPGIADIRIVILSALNSNEDIVRGYQMGANDFITKPIILEKLLNSVATQLMLVGSGQ